MSIERGPGPGVPERACFWNKGKEDWDEFEPPTSAVYLTPGAPWNWIPAPTSSPDASQSARRAVIRVLETLRQRAMAGSEVAMRAIQRGHILANKLAGVPSTRPDDPVLPPQVAAAMIQAGLVAMGLAARHDVPDPAPKPCQDPTPPAPPHPGRS